MKKLAVINVVGLSQNILESGECRFLNDFFKSGGMSHIRPICPAVTCSSQSTYVTGKLPSEHGIVGNGWYFKDLAQVWLWRQSNSLVQSEKVWEQIRSKNPNFTCANLFWWYNMYSSVNYSITPRPVYRADGLKLPDIYTEPPQLATDLQKKLGTFPLFNFWGPNANITSSQWIADASMEVYKKYQPDLNLVYLPHLDYILQKEGPHGPHVKEGIQKIDRLCQNLISFYKKSGVEVMVLSEYGINEVNHCIRINHFFREQGWLAVRGECGEDHFDAGASEVFAVADHQIAHIYVKDKNKISEVKTALQKLDGIEKILDSHTKKNFGLDHDRSGDLVAIAKTRSWFSYRYWLDDTKAPDYARTVDIHRKPGYDPVELFLDPQIKFPLLKVIFTLLKKKLGFRYSMDVIPLDESLIKGSHGSPLVPKEYWPVLLTENVNKPILEATEIKDLILRKCLE